MAGAEVVIDFTLANSVRRHTARMRGRIAARWCWVRRALSADASARLRASATTDTDRLRAEHESRCERDDRIWLELQRARSATSFESRFSMPIIATRSMRLRARRSHSAKASRPLGGQRAGARSPVIDGNAGARKGGQIGSPRCAAAIIVGEHRVTFAGPGEPLAPDASRQRPIDLCARSAACRPAGWSAGRPISLHGRFIFVNQLDTICSDNGIAQGKRPHSVFEVPGGVDSNGSSP